MDWRDELKKLLMEISKKTARIHVLYQTRSERPKDTVLSRLWETTSCATDINHFVNEANKYLDGLNVQGLDY